MYNELELLSLSHFLSTLVCILVIIYLPKYFISATESKKNIFKLIIEIIETVLVAETGQSTIA